MSCRQSNKGYEYIYTHSIHKLNFKHSLPDHQGLIPWRAEGSTGDTDGGRLLLTANTVRKRNKWAQTCMQTDRLQKNMILLGK